MGQQAKQHIQKAVASSLEKNKKSRSAAAAAAVIFGYSHPFESVNRCSHAHLAALLTHKIIFVFS